MKLFETTTIKIKKTTVFAAAFFVIIAVTVFMLINAYSEMMNSQELSQPEPLTDTENIELIQLMPPADDAASAIISTTSGDIRIVLYSDEAPNAVKLFCDTAAADGYDSLVCGLYEQGSVFTLDAPAIEGTYSAELHKNLWPFKGAVCMNESGDIIFINTVAFSEEDRQYLSEEGELYEVRTAFLEHGGVPNYARKYAVFGQITEGIEILEQIASSPMDTVITVKDVTIEE